MSGARVVHPAIPVFYSRHLYPSIPAFCPRHSRVLHPVIPAFSIPSFPRRRESRRADAAAEPKTAARSRAAARRAVSTVQTFRSVWMRPL